AAAIEQCVDVDDEQRAGLVGPIADRPVPAQIEQKPVALDVEMGVVRNLDLLLGSLAVLDIEDAAEEIRPADEAGAWMVPAEFAPAPGDHLRAFAFEHDRRCLEWCAALPAAHGARIA